MTSGSISGTDDIFATQEETKDSFECYHFKIKKKDYIGLKDCLVANSIITLSEDLSSVHSIHIGCTEPSIIPVPGDLRPLASMGIHIH